LNTKETCVSSVSTVLHTLSSSIPDFRFYIKYDRVLLPSDGSIDE
jgi:hypothetical protein